MKGNFNDIINNGKLVLIDFFAEWCGPCKTQTPIIEDLAKSVNDQVRILKIDVDKNQTLAQKYQVRGVPTLALFKNGKIVWRQSGVHSKEQLQQVILQNLN